MIVYNYTIKKILIIAMSIVVLVCVPATTFCMKKESNREISDQISIFDVDGVVAGFTAMATRRASSGVLGPIVAQFSASWLDSFELSKEISDLCEVFSSQSHTDTVDISVIEPQDPSGDQELSDLLKELGREFDIDSEDNLSHRIIKHAKIFLKKSVLFVSKQTSIKKALELLEVDLAIVRDACSRWGALRGTSSFCHPVALSESLELYSFLEGVYEEIVGKIANE